LAYALASAAAMIVLKSISNTSEHYIGPRVVKEQSFILYAEASRD